MKNPTNISSELGLGGPDNDINSDLDSDVLSAPSEIGDINDNINDDSCVTSPIKSLVLPPCTTTVSDSEINNEIGFKLNFDSEIGGPGVNNDYDVNTDNDDDIDNLNGTVLTQTDGSDGGDDTKTMTNTKVSMIDFASSPHQQSPQFGISDSPTVVSKTVEATNGNTNNFTNLNKFQDTTVFTPDLQSLSNLNLDVKVNDNEDLKDNQLVNTVTDTTENRSKNLDCNGNDITENLIIQSELSEDSTTKSISDDKTMFSNNEISNLNVSSCSKNLLLSNNKTNSKPVRKDTASVMNRTTAASRSKKFDKEKRQEEIAFQEQFLMRAPQSDLVKSGRKNKDSNTDSETVVKESKSSNSNESNPSNSLISDHKKTPIKNSTYSSSSMKRPSLSKSQTSSTKSPIEKTCSESQLNTEESQSESHSQSQNCNNFKLINGQLVNPSLVKGTPNSRMSITPKSARNSLKTMSSQFTGSTKAPMSEISSSLSTAKKSEDNLPYTSHKSSKSKKSSKIKSESSSSSSKSKDSESKSKTKLKNNSTTKSTTKTSSSTPATEPTHFDISTPCASATSSSSSLDDINNDLNLVKTTSSRDGSSGSMSHGDLSIRRLHEFRWDDCPIFDATPREEPVPESPPKNQESPEKSLIKGKNYDMERRVREKLMGKSQAFKLNSNSNTGADSDSFKLKSCPDSSMINISTPNNSTGSAGIAGRFIGKCINLTAMKNNSMTGETVPTPTRTSSLTMDNIDRVVTTTSDINTKLAKTKSNTNSSDSNTVIKSSKVSKTHIATPTSSSTTVTVTYPNPNPIPNRPKSQRTIHPVDYKHFAGVQPTVADLKTQMERKCDPEISKSGKIWVKPQNQNQNHMNQNLNCSSKFVNNSSFSNTKQLQTMTMCSFKDKRSTNTSGKPISQNLNYDKSAKTSKTEHKNNKISKNVYNVSNDVFNLSPCSAHKELNPGYYSDHKQKWSSYTKIFIRRLISSLLHTLLVWSMAYLIISSSTNYVNSGGAKTDFDIIVLNMNKIWKTYDDEGVISKMILDFSNLRIYSDFRPTVNFGSAQSHGVTVPKLLRGRHNAVDSKLYKASESESTAQRLVNLNLNQGKLSEKSYYYRNSVFNYETVCTSKSMLISSESDSNADKASNLSYKRVPVFEELYKNDNVNQNSGVIKINHNVIDTAVANPKNSQITVKSQSQQESDSESDYEKNKIISDVTTNLHYNMTDDLDSNMCFLKVNYDIPAGLTDVANIDSKSSGNLSNSSNENSDLSASADKQQQRSQAKDESNIPPKSDSESDFETVDSDFAPDIDSSKTVIVSVPPVSSDIDFNASQDPFKIDAMSSGVVSSFLTAVAGLITGKATGRL